ncbi:MAG: hypothetical protein E7394_07210 [Ruminococcaceae bacterium]|nr:hypothetical protein [Oscillospiraceae bacterium]
MKNFLLKWIPWIVIAVMVLTLIPTIAKRVEVESSNKNVVMALDYNDIDTKVSSEKMDEFLIEIKNEGVNIVSVMEENVNSLTSKGYVTCIKYNVLCHKYDDESIRVANAIRENCPGVSYDSHVVLVKNPAYRVKFKEMISLKFTDKEYDSIENVENMDLYVLYDGRIELWDYSLGYDTDTLDKLSAMGFEIALTHKLNSYRSTNYIPVMEDIIKEYNVRYLNLKKAKLPVNFTDYNPANYEGVAELINKYDMTLVVTENTDQLGNEQFYGYGYVFDKVMGDGGTKKVMRSYETNDDSQADASYYLYRTNQFHNSTVDRNLKFITLTQIAPEGIPYDDCADYTLMAAREYISKIKSLGYTVNSDPVSLDYETNKTLSSASCAVIMIMALLLMWQMLSGKKCEKLFAVALILSALAFLVTFKMPDALLSLYPTAYSALQSCFVMTLVLWFVKEYREKLSLAVLLISTLAIALISLMIGSLGMGAMLSGIEYYVNNVFFRGIKVSLMAPLAYTAVVYYFFFMKDSKKTIGSDIKKVLFSEIKVYWVLIALVIGAVGVYYIIRSGNVTEISPIEQALRDKVTDIFPARPRTKEFLIGYPSLVLFVYYAKKTNIHLLQWGFAVGTSILAASVTNSFCHVFTDYQTICMRVVNGLIVGTLISIAVLIANAIIVKLVKTVREKN